MDNVFCSECSETIKFFNSCSTFPTKESMSFYFIVHAGEVTSKSKNQIVVKKLSATVSLILSTLEQYDQCRI